MRRLMIVFFASVLVLVAPAFGKPGTSPSSATIAASANPILVGSSTLISGQATGKKAAGASVDLQAEPAGSSSFSKVATTTADSTGHYSFKVSPDVNTSYRVMAKTAPSATSSSLRVNVRVKVTMGVSKTQPAAGQLVRFSGFVLPAYVGKTVFIQRKTARGWTTLAQAKLMAATPLGSTTRSRYRKQIRFRKSGLYRVLFSQTGITNLPNGSPARRLT
jgi:hypothetical protein